MFEAAKRRVVATSALIGGAALAVVLASACTGEDRPNVEVIGGDGVVSVSGAFEGGPPAQPSGRRYAYSVEPTIDLAAALDLRALRSVINVALDGRPVDWARATDVYENGRNQQRADGTLRSLADLATDEAALATFPDGAAVYGRDSFIDGIIRDALTGTGRAQGLSDDARRAIVEGGVQMLLAAQSSSHLDAAGARLAAREAQPNALVDSAWAFIGGPLDGEDRPSALLPAIYGIETDLGLERKLEQPMEIGYIDARTAAERGDAGAFETRAREGRAHLTAYFYLATLRAAKDAETATSEAARQVRLAEGWTAFQAIRAVVAGASPTAAERVEAALSRPGTEAFPATETQQVYEALNEAAVLEALGIPADLQLKAPAN